MVSIGMLADKVAKLERADAIQNSKIKQLEIECGSLRSMLDDVHTGDDLGTHLQEIGEQMQEVGVILRDGQ